MMADESRKGSQHFGGNPAISSSHNQTQTMISGGEWIMMMMMFGGKEVRDTGPF